MESSIDVAIAVGSLAADSHETPARLHPPAVIVETGDLRIALLREVFRTVQQLKEVHSTRIIATLYACEGSGIADVPTKELAAEGLENPIDRIGIGLATAPCSGNLRLGAWAANSEKDEYGAVQPDDVVVGKTANKHADFRS
jgi:hypothetical protein